MPKQAQQFGGGTASNNSQPSIRRKWVVSTSLQPLYPQERPGSFYTGGWVQKASLPQEFDRQAVCSVASCYTDFTTPADVAVYLHKLLCIMLIILV
jgi:hypothetical protein